MKNQDPVKTTEKLKTEARNKEYHHRLADLEHEIKSYPAKKGTPVGLSDVEDVTEAVIAKEKVVRFVYNKNTYSLGHIDKTYAGSNNSHGVRYVRFYDGKGKIVLEIEGNFEDQQFGSNFTFHAVQIYLPGPWETDFAALTDELIAHQARKKEEFKQRRASDKNRMERGHSRF